LHGAIYVARCNLIAYLAFATFRTNAIKGGYEMAVFEAVVAHDQDRQQERAVVAALRQALARGLSGASAEQIQIAGQIKAFIEWLDDPRPAFAEQLGADDKFPQLIGISRLYQDCTTFYVSDVGVNPSTVWRWASGKSRPSKFVGKRLVTEVENRLADILLELATDVGLINSPIVVMSKS
jgi:hypothetical protein